MNRSKKISVCLNTYNHAPYIKYAIEGVLEQKHEYEWEFIISDDCSTDGASEIIGRYAELYPDLISAKLRSTNVGAAKNGYELLASATGEYIAYLEGDDYWVDEYKIRTQVDFLDSNQEYGLVWTDVDFEYVESGKIVKNVFKSEILPMYSSFKDVLINKPFFSPSTWVFRRNLNSACKYYEYCDGTFPFIMDVMHETKIKHMPKVTARYRVLEESASNSKNLSKRYSFLCGVNKIQTTYMDKYDFDIKTKYEVKELQIKQELPYAIMLEDQLAIKNHILELKKHDFTIDLKLKVLLLLAKTQLGRSATKTLYKSKILKLIVSKIRRLL